MRDPDSSPLARHPASDDPLGAEPPAFAVGPETIREIPPTGQEPPPVDTDRATVMVDATDRQAADFILAEEGDAAQVEWNRATVCDELPQPHGGSRPIPEIPGFSIEGTLGRGATGVVYLARQLKLNRLCALKLILAGAHAEPESALRFLYEAEAVARLRHPNIVQIYCIGEVEGLPFLELELVEGGSLEQRLDGQPWDPERAARLIQSAALAIEHAHASGVVHRDLKPANLLLTPQEVPKVADFGLAKAINNDVHLTRTRIIMGSPGYMAPEQAEGRTREAGPAADIYALGAIFYELLTGRPPFRGESILETLEQVKTCEPVVPSRLVAGVPRDVETICLKCLEKSPAQRYATAADLAEDLGRFCAGDPIRARRVASPERAWRWCRRNSTIALLAGSLVLLLAFLTVAATVVSFVFKSQLDLARAHLLRALHAEQTQAEMLRSSYLDQARARRWSGSVGRREASLDALRKAAAIRPGPELRDEAIACLVLPDLEPFESPLPLPQGAPVIALDRDFGRYAVSEAGGAITVRNRPDRSPIARLAVAASAPPAAAIQFQPGGDRLAAIHPTGPGAYLLRVWDLRTRKPLWERADVGRVVAWSPDGSQMAVARASQGPVDLLDATTGRRARSLAGDRSPAAIAFSPDGLTLALGFRDAGALQLHDLETGEIRWNRPVPADVHAVAWHPGGRLLGLACSDQRIHVLDVIDRHEHFEMIGHQSDVVGLAFSHDGALLATQGWDRSLRLWDAWTGDPLLLLPTDDAVACQFSRDDLLLLGTAQGGGVQLWARNAGRELSVLRGYEGPEKGPWSVAYHPSGRLLAVAEPDGVRLWDPDRARLLAHLPCGRSAAVVFAADGNALITSSARSVLSWPLAARDPATPSEWTIGPPRELYRAPEAIHTGGLALSRDGRVLALLDRSGGSVVVLELDRPDQPPRRLGEGLRVASVAVSPDGRWIAAGTWHGTGTRLWDRSTGEVVFTLRDGDATVEFSPDGRLLVVGNESEYRFLEVPTWRSVRSLPRDPQGLGRVAFGPGSRLLAFAQDAHEVRLYDTARGEILARLSTPRPLLITAMVLRPDRRQLAVATENQAVELWDLARIGETLHVLGLAPAGASTWEPIRPAPEAVAAIHLDPGDGALLPDLGAALVEERRWDEAARVFARAAEHRPGDLVLWEADLLARIQLGDLAGYRARCAQALARLASETRPDRINDLAWGMVLGPVALDDYALALERTRALAAATPDSYLRLTTLGALEYRSGQFDRAIRTLERATVLHGQGGTPFDWLFLAMAHHARGQPAKAQVYLGHTLRWVDQTDYVDPQFDGVLGWQIRWQWRLLLREARSRLEAPPPEPGWPDDVFVPDDRRADPTTGGLHRLPQTVLRDFGRASCGPPRSL